MSQKIKGFTGKYLRINLTNGTLRNLSFDNQTYRAYLGGTGVGSKILYEEVPPDVCWSDPVNRVIIASGPLGGTSIGGSGTISLVTKGALTGGATSSQANGLFGAYLRFSGYDGMIVHGASNKWKYLVLRKDGAELRDASDILGLDTYETYDALRKEFGIKGRSASVLSIGPAGENLVRWAGVFVDHGHSASHNGPGAVLGSKKIKAMIAFMGKGGFDVHDPERLRTVSKKMYDDVEWFKGTIGLVKSVYDSGRGEIPIRNYTTNDWNISAKKLESFGFESIRTNFQVNRAPCWGCKLLHCTMMQIQNKSYNGLIEEPEYEQMNAWGPLIGSENVEAAIMLSGLTDRLGLENNEAGWLIAWLMECFDRGLITEEDTGGLKIKWGDIHIVEKLLKMISERRGFGNVLAEGLKSVSNKIGGEAAKAAIYTLKGNTPRGHDHRTSWAEMFDTCVSNTGTIETHMGVMGPEAQGTRNPFIISTEVANTKGLMQFEDSVGTCRFNTRMNAKLIAEAVSASTGWDFTAREGKRVGLRAVNLMRAYNLRVGIGKDLDHPSARYGSTPIDGPAEGISIIPYWDDMLSNYYKLMGWNPETGIPLPETLEYLGISHIINDLEDMREVTQQKR